ncbi:hypothetical protein D0Y65_048665, partial [Glycine soja]
ALGVAKPSVASYLSQEILAEQEADRVHGLPAQPPVKFKNMVVISLSMKLKAQHCSMVFRSHSQTRTKTRSLMAQWSLEGNASALTNFEVLDFLRAKGASKDPTRVIAKVAQSEYKVYDYLVDTAASIQTRESINEFLTSVK